MIHQCLDVCCYPHCSNILETILVMMMMMLFRLLSNIETILVRATVVRDMEEAMLKKVEI